MAYDNYGRWIPSEDINWTTSTTDVIQQLQDSGIDWGDEGANVFQTDAWGDMDETSRLDVLQHYDTWYDAGEAANAADPTSTQAKEWKINLVDSQWGLDLERSLSYNSNWTAQEAFNALTGGGFTIQTSDKTQYEVEHGQHKTGWAEDNVRHHFISSEYNTGTGQWETKWIEREHKMDWKNYSTDDLYRATIDEMMEADPDSFLSSGWDFQNAKQVRVATSIIQGWKDDIQKEADDNGYDNDWVQNKIASTFSEQIASGKITNERLPTNGKEKSTDDFGTAVSGPEANQQRRLKYHGWKTWHKFDPVTGTSTKFDPRSGDIKDTFTHAPPAAPTRMTVTGDKTLANIDEGIYFSNTIDSEQNITDSLQQKPDDPLPPTLTIRKVNVKKPANIDASWKMKGNLKGPAA
tara:strand:+ start:69 stop:1289 length:1221 start_codon:yes stop_codon:yes gene_type:complete